MSKIMFSEARPDLLDEWHPDNEMTPDKVTRSSAKRILWQCRYCGVNWEATPANRVRAKGGCKSCATARGLASTDRKRTVTLAEARPDLASQIHPDSPRQADQISPASRYDALWLCPDCGDSWTASPYLRTHGGGKCPCKVSPPLSDTHPEIARDVVPTDEYTADTLTPGSGVVVEWKCHKCNNTWSSRVIDRTKGGNRCRSCVPISIKKSVAEARPDLAVEWHPSNTLRPDQVGTGSKETILWRCASGHEWKTSVAARIRGTGCPGCLAAERATRKARRDKDRAEHAEARTQERLRRAEAARLRRAEEALLRRRVRIEETGRSLLIAHPDLAAQINDGKDPRDLSVGSGVRVQWRCPEGHEFESTVKDRVRAPRCPYCSRRRAHLGATDLATLRPDLLADWHPGNTVDPSTILAGSNTRVMWRCSTCSHEWLAPPNDRSGRGSGCPCCVRGGRSSSEVEITDALDSLIPGINYQTNVRGLLGGQFEIDIWFPDHRIGVEHNGIYWHTEQNKTPITYHRDKAHDAWRNGISLIQIWEDDWRDRRNIVLSLLVNKLGGDKESPIGARECRVSDIDYSEAMEFLDRTHLLGGRRGTRYLGLVDRSGELVAAMVTRRQGSNWYIERYSTARRVPGGFTRLLRELEREITAAGGGTVLTFSDNCISSGDLYRASGFRKDEELRPDYTYAVPARGGCVRRHKFGYRKSRFERDPDLFFDPSMTEKELAAANKLWRVWDAGKIRWALDVPAEDGPTPGR